MSASSLPAEVTGTVVTVGTFDGVHLGHRQVLDEIANRADRSGLSSLLVTFEPHPLEIVNPDAAPPLLTLAPERREILAQSMLHYAVFLTFTTELSQLSPTAFVRLLLDRFRMRELVIGYDHGFGRGRTGDVAVLKTLGSELDFAVDVVGAISSGTRPVSSTWIRRAVAGGDLASAARLLGRPYSMLARVVRGTGRGRELGYRTINLAVGDERKLLPPNGVYAVRVEWNNGSASGMMHLGPRPTFGEAERSLEVHLLDREVNLYGDLVKVSWIARLRDVIRFDSPEQLSRQLEQDFEAARSALTGTGG